MPNGVTIPALEGTSGERWHRVFWDTCLLTSATSRSPTRARMAEAPGNSYQAFIFKSTATAQTPALTVLGTLTAARRRPSLTLRHDHRSARRERRDLHIARVTASHDGHEQAFGPDWKQRISPDAERRLLQHRRSMRLPRVPEPHWTRDVPCCTIPGTDRQLLADMWEPAAGVERSGTAIVYLYGGSWHFFDKDVLTRPLFRQLTAQGHVVMDAAHRSCAETDVIGMGATCTAPSRGSRRMPSATGSTPSGSS